jgi:hypothetical protein
MRELSQNMLNAVSRTIKMMNRSGFGCSYTQQNWIRDNESINESVSVTNNTDKWRDFALNRNRINVEEHNEMVRNLAKEYISRFAKSAMFNKMLDNKTDD